MRKWMMSAVVSAAAVLLLAACGTSTTTGNNTTGAATGDLYNQIKSKGVITVGTEGTYAPFDYHDPSGKLVGFDIDIMNEVARRLGVKAQYVETPWDGMFAGLNAKRFDVIADEVGILPDREKQYDFSTPYIASHAVLIVRNDNNTIHSFADLKGKTAGQSLTSNLSAIARQNGANIVATQGFNDAIDLLKSGRIDATVNDELSYLDLKKHQPDAPVKVVATWPKATYSGFMFRKGNQALVQAVDKALADMKKDGTYLKISKKWFGADVSK